MRSGGADAMLGSAGLWMFGYRGQRGAGAAKADKGRDSVLALPPN